MFAGKKEGRGSIFFQTYKNGVKMPNFNEDLICSDKNTSKVFVVVLKCIPYAMYCIYSIQSCIHR